MFLVYKGLCNWRRSYIQLICGIISYVSLVSLRCLILFYQDSFILLKEKMRTLEENESELIFVQCLLWAKYFTLINYFKPSNNPGGGYYYHSAEQKLNL